MWKAIQTLLRLPPRALAPAERFAQPPRREVQPDAFIVPPFEPPVQNPREVEVGPTSALARAASQRPSFDGLSLFARIDREPVVRLERGNRGQEGYERLEYFPRTAEYQRGRLVRKDNGALRNVGFKLEMRSGLLSLNGLASSVSTHTHSTPRGPLDRELAELCEALNVPVPDRTRPEGHGEVLAAVRAIQAQAPVRAEDVQPGEWVLYETYNRGWMLARIAELEPHSVQGATVFAPWVRSRDEAVSISDNGALGKPEPTFERERNAYELLPAVQPDGMPRYDVKPQALWRASPQDAAAVLAHAPRATDPLAFSELSREAFTLYCSLQALQYARWGKDEQPGPEHREIHPKGYAQALDVLIARFGEAALLDSARTLFDQHLQSLHTQVHMPHGIYGPHSDVGPLGPEFTELAREATWGLQPVPHNMRDSGHVVNVKTLFGDADFWRHLRDHYPVAFHALVDHLRDLPAPLTTHGTYASAEVDPVGVVQRFFPEAYAVVHAMRPDFAPRLAEAIRVLPR